jgi:hypothetical protein
MTQTEEKKPTVDKNTKCSFCGLSIDQTKYLFITEKANICKICSNNALISIVNAEIGNQAPKGTVVQ